MMGPWVCVSARVCDGSMPIGDPDMPDFKSYDQIQREIVDLEKRLGRRLTTTRSRSYEREALRKSMQDILRVLNAN
jgi:uncharacterized protein involved in exopolysaccharide biosynthesis